MKKTLVLAIVAGVMWISSAEVCADNYYVDATGGNDNRNGKHYNHQGGNDGPFKTIQKAADTVGAGDTVIAKDGTYTDTNTLDSVVSMRNSGTSNGWITFRAENKGGAVIDGKNGKTKVGFFLCKASFIRIEGFEIKNFDTTGIYCAPAHDIYIYQNKIHGNGRHWLDTACANTKFPSGITAKADAYNITVDGNLLYDIGKQHRYDYGYGCCDHDYKHDHAIYAIGKNWLIKNNIIYDMHSGWPIKVSGHNGAMEGPTHIITNNIFAHDVNDGVRSGCYTKARGHIWLTDGKGNLDAHNIIIQNNVFYNPPGNSIIQNATDNVLDTAVIRNNVTSSANLISGNPGTPTLSNNNTNLPLPGFNLTDPSNNNFTLTSSATYLIDKGISANAPSYDFTGAPRDASPDIGAYEYGSVIIDSTSPIVTFFTINPTTVNTNQTITINYTVTDNKALKQAELYRKKGSGSWVQLSDKTQSVSGTSSSGSFTDSISTAGTYWYGMHVVDQAGNEGVEPSVISVTVTDGNIYYVSPSGSDANPGTMSQPWKSIDYALSASSGVQAGDIIIVKDGTYTRRTGASGDKSVVYPQISGAADDWITIRTENEHQAILDGENTAALTDGVIYIYGKSFLRFEGFDIRRGRRAVMFGGGAVCNSSGRCHDIYFYNCIFRDTEANIVAVETSTTLNARESSYNITIDRCEFYNNGPTLTDTSYHRWCHNIYAKGAGWVIKNNVFSNANAGRFIKIEGHCASEIPLSARTPYTHLIINNTFGKTGDFSSYGCEGYIYAGHDHDENGLPVVFIYNNVAYDPPGDRFVDGSGSLNAYHFQNNVTSVDYLCEITTPGTDTNNKYGYTKISKGNFRLTDPDNDDYLITAYSSYLIDKGISANAPSYDFTGAPRPQGSGYDIGAYEYYGLGEVTDVESEK